MLQVWPVLQSLDSPDAANIEVNTRGLHISHQHSKNIPSSWETIIVSFFFLLDLLTEQCLGRIGLQRFYSVHQLYPDDDLSTPNHDHKLTLIFFHSPADDNLDGSKTWIQRRHPEVCWPRDWLPKAPVDQGLGTDIRVLSVAYPVPRSVKEWVKHMMKLLICRYDPPWAARVPLVFRLLSLLVMERLRVG
jgi:hypothetical protein